MCVYIQLYTCVYIHIYTCVCMCVCVCVCVYIYIYIYIKYNLNGFAYPKVGCAEAQLVEALRYKSEGRGLSLT